MNCSPTIPTTPETFNGKLPLPPAKHVAVVACMDARLDVYRILGLNEGEAHVIRKAGGVITDDEIRSLAISQPALNDIGQQGRRYVVDVLRDTIRRSAGQPTKRRPSRSAGAPSAGPGPQ